MLRYTTSMLLTYLALGLTARPAAAASNEARCAEHMSQFVQMTEELLTTAEGQALARAHIEPRRAATTTLIAACTAGDRIKNAGQCDAALQSYVTPAVRQESAPVGYWHRWQGSLAMRPLNVKFRRLRLDGCLQSAVGRAGLRTLLLWADPDAMSLRGPLFVEQLGDDIRAAFATPEGQALQATSSFKTLIETAGDVYALSTNADEEDEAVTEALVEELLAARQQEPGDLYRAVRQSPEWAALADRLALQVGTSDWDVGAATFGELVERRWVAPLSRDDGARLTALAATADSDDDVTVYIDSDLEDSDDDDASGPLPPKPEICERVPCELEGEGDDLHWVPMKESFTEGNFDIDVQVIDEQGALGHEAWDRLPGITETRFLR